MRKLMSLLILTAASSAFSEIISCPTPDNYSVNGTPWELSLEKLVFSNPACDLPVNKFFKYDPLTKKIEEYGSEVTAINFDVTVTQVAQNEKGITLQCTGTYSSSERTSRDSSSICRWCDKSDHILTYHFLIVPDALCIAWACDTRHLTGIIKTEFLVGNNYYKECKIVDNKSFDCSK